MGLSRAELFAAIRRDKRLDPELSQRALAEKYGVHRRTVRQALLSAVPPPRKKPAPRVAVLDPAKPWIDAMLREDANAPRKQKHTARRIYQRLAQEYDFDLVSYSTVCDYVLARRPQIEAEVLEGRRHLTGMVPQVHLPGEEAEVDFADVWVRLAGQAVKCHLFTLRLSYSGKAVHRVYASQAQESFMEGHVEAFNVLGGVPTRHIRYDNLKPAVNRICTGRSRIESERWVSFRAHYGFDAFYCVPGEDGAHEKGGVEHEGGRFRRTHLVPVPEVATLEELNAKIAEIDAAEDERILAGKLTTVGFNFFTEADQLTPLPLEEFECGITLTPKVDRSSRITVRQCYYSVPARFIGQNVRVLLRGNELLVFERREIVARHPRLTRRGDFRDELDHYLEILLTKPGAMAGSTALVTARQNGSFTEVHEAFWAAARTAHGDAAGTRALIEVLLLHRRMPADVVEQGMAAAIRAGTTSADVVAVEARRAAALAPPPADDVDDEGDPPPWAEPSGVVSLTARRAQLPEDRRPLPDVAHYDQLLTRQPKGTA
ncbi:IS21 family transposase [Streptomyces rapamycinicus]|uniref:Transposase n=1 Tax=Streptomyces rapamycinicus (strain ATCC 29253 / DSM 41530 / NRRL 5491 / AYB-994) TaxID=1343740 RepID=A0A3L8RDL6_STRRN|nr:IS21 family transposase [Streptomyces rapamycinicus]RLV77670.1 transposase [Streptomyces rapamycinicus NRRL 5491]UTO66902.1 IS21 family transposase [Streptomyces rapamycinicus]UTP34857.1 IS21 family transposase [Streptomyces rapamycinicus NRRL 5491]